MPPPHVAQWLANALSTYLYKPQITQAIHLALDTYPSLKVKTDQYTHDDGRTLLLLTLHGTLPITYASNRYNVPLAIWFPHDFPRTSPMVYVVPTSTMLVRKGNGVALDGRIEDEGEGSYLAGWKRKWEAHSLEGLLQHLVERFSTTPPVYAKPKTTAGSTPSSSSAISAERPSSSSYDGQARPPPPPTPPTGTHQQYQQHQQSSPPPPPPVPSVPSHPSHSPSHSRQSSLNAGPPPPPLPHQSPIRSSSTSSHSGYLPQQQYSQYQQFSPVQQPPYGPTGSLSPQHVYSPARPPPSTHHPPRPTHSQSLPPSSVSVYIAPQSSYQHNPALNAHPSSHIPSTSQQQWQQPPYLAPPLHTQPSLGIHAPHPSSSSSRSLHSATNAPISASTSSSAVPKPREPILDLLSAEDDDSSPLSPNPTLNSTSTNSATNPPPRPLSPPLLALHQTVHEALSTSLSPILHPLTQTLGSLTQLQSTLLAAPAAIEDESSRLRAVRDVCEGVGRELEGIVGAGEERVRWLKERGEVGVDELVCATSIVGNQLIDLLAEDCAISDTIYQLDRALSAERLDLERFLKVTRGLAREQFMKRALVEKILRGGN